MQLTLEAGFTSIPCEWTIAFVDVYASVDLLDADLSSDMSDSEQADDDLPSGKHDLPSGEHDLPSGEHDLPSGKQCQKASEEFAAVTGTDTALAMFYLQGTW